MVLSNPFSKSSKKKKADNSTRNESLDSPPPSPPKKSPTKTPRDRDFRSDKNNFKPDREPRPRPDFSNRGHSRPIGSTHYSYDQNSHPLNLPPHELRRLSAISTMSDPPTPMDVDQDNGSSSAPPSSPPPAFSATNGVNGDGSPMPPPHRTPASPPPQQPQQPQQPRKPEVDAEACKATGNKFFKAKEYDKAIKEYTKGRLKP